MPLSVPETGIAVTRKLAFDVVAGQAPFPAIKYCIVTVVSAVISAGV